ncbi:MAG: c-type cytochrome [Planctomycetia bacterium]|nr:c-type cytochrome [Planctomycetia bacterium]
MCKVRFRWCLIAAAFASPAILAAEQLPTAPPLLEKQLLAEGAEALARAARTQGDAVRGAILFHQPQFTCVKCHVPQDRAAPLGPDLARPADKPSDVYLIESVLLPSKAIRKGFESVTVLTKQGGTITGLLVKEDETQIVLRDPAQDFKAVTLPRADIEERAPSPTSLMPTGLANQLTTRQQFLDLACYLIEIAEKGPKRAEELQPPPSLYAQLPIPEYEKDIDHAGLISGADAGSLKRGEAIYQRTCINCHGTKAKPGSMPTSLPFASGKFKNGSDPYSIYRTLTHGFGLMAPQFWMVPRQKYDVIHYIREAYLKPFNREQYVAVDTDYLARLPKGTSRGPAPSSIDPWVQMDYGPSLIHTYEIGNAGTNFAYKGIAIRLDDGPGGVSRGRSWVVYDQDTLRLAAVWNGRDFIDWNGIQFNGRHEVHPRIAGQVQLATPMGPGWANPVDGSFADPRLKGRDGRHYGPLPRSWSRYRGLYHYGNKVILSYSIGDTPVLEMPGLTTAGSAVLFSRTVNLGPRERDLVLEAGHLPGKATLRPLAKGPAGATLLANEMQQLLAGFSPALRDVRWSATDGRLCLHIPAGKEPLRFTLWCGELAQPGEAERIANAVKPQGMDLDLAPLTRGGGGRRWPTTISLPVQSGAESGPFAVDVFPPPLGNPWSCLTRFSGVDFYPDGKHAALCTWDGDVWRISGLDRPKGDIIWQRIASGLFQPLGLKIIDGKIYVSCRDQIAVLHDLDGDGETDFYENFNNDHQVTEHFHEFAMGLQTDGDGNLYYARAARHAKPAVVPHHGTLLRVSRDGTRTDILATGFRAPNGVCVNPDGTFFLTDQEGHWTPKNRINWVQKDGFYGNMLGYHDVNETSNAAMKQPLCWITNAFDRSPAELLWTPRNAWGPLGGTLLNLSYGNGKVFAVPHETINGQMQGGMVALPMPAFPTGVMRGRFHPTDGQLYLCGMTAWGSSQPLAGGFYRLRYTGKPAHVPVGLEARKAGLTLRFSDALERTSVTVENFALKTWGLRRSAGYGSKHLDEKPARVTAARLADDGRTVQLDIADLQPTWGMEIRYTLQGAAGEKVSGTIHNTIHQLQP